MEYFKCNWIHNFEDEPILLYSELDDDRNEIRKIEIFKNGKIGYADKSIHTEKTDLSLVPIPLINEINKENEFNAVIITKEEFEELWEKRLI